MGMRSCADARRQRGGTRGGTRGGETRRTPRPDTRRARRARGTPFDRQAPSRHARFGETTPRRVRAPNAPLSAARRPPVAPAPAHAGRAIAHVHHGARPMHRPAPRKDLQGHDVQALPGAAARRATCARRANRRRTPSAASPGRRPAPLLRHKWVPHTPPARPAHRRCRLPDLRVPAPPRLIGRAGGSASEGAPTAVAWDACPRPWKPVVDGPWITGSGGPKLVDRTPCGQGRPRAIIRSARRGRDERTAGRRKAAGLLARGAGPSARRVGPSAREAKRFDGRTGAARHRARSREREVLRKERRSRPQGRRVPRKGGEATGSAVLSGAFVPGARSGAEASRM